MKRFRLDFILQNYLIPIYLKYFESDPTISNGSYVILINLKIDVSPELFPIFKHARGNKLAIIELTLSDRS